MHSFGGEGKPMTIVDVHPGQRLRREHARLTASLDDLL